MLDGVVGTMRRLQREASGVGRTSTTTIARTSLSAGRLLKRGYTPSAPASAGNVSCSA